MNDQWPPEAPHIKKAFEKAHDAKIEPIVPANSKEIVTRKQVEDLEKLRKAPVTQLHLTPRGAKPMRTIDDERAARLERMKERLRQKQGKARDDFGRSA